MSRPVRNSHVFVAFHLLPALATIAAMFLNAPMPIADAFAPGRPSSHRLRAAFYESRSTASTTTSLSAMNKRNSKFNKQKDLAAKMAEAKRQRELAETGEGGDGEGESPKQAMDDSDSNKISAEEIKLRNDRQRFADMLDNSMSGGSDLDKGYYLTVEQENESADAVFKGVDRLYEGDPAPTSPFAELLNIQNGEPIGKGGMKRIVPWEGSRSAASGDYLVVITDPRPKSLELRTAMKRLSGALGADALGRCMVINTDSPGENRRFLKKNFGGDESEKGLRIYCDDNMEWMREYTALGEKRFSMTMFVLRDGRVEKIAREVEAEMLPMVVKNAISSLTNAK